MEKTMFSVAIVATLSLWGSWASAESAYEDDFDADDAAFFAELEAEEAEEAVADVDAYNLALRDVAAAPAFCAVVLVQRDETHTWRTVCVLGAEERYGVQ